MNSLKEYTKGKLTHLEKISKISIIRGRHHTYKFKLDKHTQ